MRMLKGLAGLGFAFCCYMGEAEHERAKAMVVWEDPSGGGSLPEAQAACLAMATNTVPRFPNESNEEFVAQMGQAIGACLVQKGYIIKGFTVDLFKGLRT